ncbi:Uncharacterized protein APZ42_012726 [Daphnia magna]|uniref:Uncharacterized protein n=1 Tax=Daphnia magna TaxID=35525 RepID=A0A162RJ69_9CRUS|nr:Uncharacterized protein APZ42_012726 [Daphnia magna]
MFERCAAITITNTELNIQPNSVVQYVADNADHNLRTIDGKDTFHGMGIIAAITPSLPQKHNCVPRRKVTDEELLNYGQIKIHSHDINQNILSKITYQKLLPLSTEDATANLDLLWMSSCLFRLPRPGWQGYMQFVMETKKHPGKSEVVFLPLIDLSASSDSCVFSTLTFLAEQAIRYNKTPIVTFDQPLYWKAMMIIANSDDSSPIRQTVLKLGGFHTLMSFIGCIGHIMEELGLQDLLNLVYATNTVPHMLSGKAISRAIRGLFLVESAVMFVLINTDIQRDHLEPTIVDSEVIPDSEKSYYSLTSSDLEELNVLFHRMLDVNAINNYEEIDKSKAFKKLQLLVETKIATFKLSRTGSVWIQLLNMFRILKTFIKAERTGNWELHLQTTMEMLPFFAAAGHSNYLKSSYVYVQNMMSLKETNPLLYHLFQSGHHVIRRSDQYWAGLSSDLVIEQDLMRTMKSSGIL